MIILTPYPIKYQFYILIYSAILTLLRCYEISSKSEVHRALLTRWKKEALDGLSGIFSKKSNKHNNDNQLIDNLNKQIGQLKVENDWLKKRLRQSITDRKELINRAHSQISINRQCDLLKVSKGALPIDPYTLILMDLIDKQHTKTPFYGSRRLTAYLKNGEGYDVNRKQLQRLMKLIRIETIYPKPKTTIGDREHKIYPYLLRDVDIVRPDQVWSTDITYIRVGKGFAYLTAILDWYSRYVLSWKLSNTLENTFCIEALEEALSYSKPEIFNTDQGSQYTASNFLKPLIDRDIKISMDSKGRALDNILKGCGDQSNTRRCIKTNRKQCSTHTSH